LIGGWYGQGPGHKEQGNQEKSGQIPEGKARSEEGEKSDQIDLVRTHTRISVRIPDRWPDGAANDQFFILHPLRPERFSMKNPATSSGVSQKNFG
jgi:hypothetical protein